VAQLRRPSLSRDWQQRKWDDGGDSGIRRSIKALLDAVDRRDPALTFIAVELQQKRHEKDELTEGDVREAVVLGRTRFDEFRQQLADRRSDRIPDSIVYYIRRGPLVKIGTTTNPHGRFRDLLPDEILAWEPGGRTEEEARHAQFKALRVSNRGEYFRRDATLDQHIHDVAAQHGAPDPTWPTIQTLERHPTSAITPEPPVAPDLVTLKDGARRLGIRYNTACVWKHRGKLKAFLEDEAGNPMYLLSDLKSLAEGVGMGSRPKGPDATTGASGPEWLAS
jgi:hypothetical protein